MIQEITTYRVNDFNKIVQYLIGNGFPILSRDSVSLILQAEMNNKQAKKIHEEITFEDLVLVEEIPN